jgi:S1-C subfamily serine protease
VRSAAAAASLAAVAMGLGGCGDDDSSGAGDEVETTPSGRTIVRAENGAFDPQTVYEEAAPGVVTIRSLFVDGGSDLLGGGGGAAQGSGFVIDENGEIITNAHVVTEDRGGDLEEAREVFVQFADLNQVPAEIVGFDPHADVALLHVEPNGLDLHALSLAGDTEFHVGQPVAAIGSPFGEEQSLSVGVISATDRSIESLTQFQIDGAIQTDASINPGNSGGPLLDAEARVLGINQQINTTSGGNEGVGFAVPIDLVIRSVEELRGEGDVSYAYLGVETQPLYPQLAARLDIPSETGALVADVTPDGPAEKAGLEGSDQTIRFQGQEVKAGGDVIVALDDEEIDDASDLPELISRLDAGDEVTLEIIRDGERRDIEVTLGERPTG